MADTGKSDESELWNAISTFERILEVLPDDRATLETLVHAYEQVGDHTRARDHILRLAAVIAAEQDREAAAGLLEKIRAYADADPGARELAGRLEALASGPSGPAAAPLAGGAAGPVQDREKTAREALRRKTGIAEELAFAWDLMQSGELSQEQYAEIVQDLTEMSGAESGLTVSLLHVLQQRGVGNLERILALASRKRATPIISLGSFDLNPEAVALVPRDYAIRRGVLPYDLLGQDPLVVVLNPYDAQLRREVQDITGRHCHFFMCSAAEFDGALGRLAQAAAESARPPKKG